MSDRVLPPSVLEMQAKAQDNDTVVILSITPEGYWALQEIDAELLRGNDDDQKAAALTYVWGFNRSIGWAREGGRKL